MAGRWFRSAAALVILACALLPSACTKKSGGGVQLGDPNDQPSAGASASPSDAALRTITSGSLTLTLPPAGDAGADAVFIGYQAFWEGLLRALAKANPGEPTLLATTTGGARSLFQNNLANLGLVRRTESGPTRLHPMVTSVTGPVANVTDCADLSALRIRGPNGRPVNPPDPQTTQIEVELVLQAGNWVVRNYQETSRGCQPGL